MTLKVPEEVYRFFMSSTVNTGAIMSTNFIGIMLMISMAMNGMWRFRSRYKEDRFLTWMFFFATVSCISDQVTALVNGKENPVCIELNMICNSTLYFSAIVAIYCWTIMMERHLFGTQKKSHYVLVSIPTLVAFILLIINFFEPVLFSVEYHNIYRRLRGYNIIVIIEIGYLLYAFLRYFTAKLRGGLFKFFPVWNFVIPVFAGVIIQSFVYGISIVPASCAVASASICTSLQNELIYRDDLTGLFNRAYLEYILTKLEGGKSKKLTGVMMDMNDFKGINDTYGHSVGDEALVNVSRILEHCVSEYGSVIRFAGDEFILLINSTDENVTKPLLDKITDELDEFNKTGDYEYKLSLSYGMEIFEPTKEGRTEFFNKIDKKMYESKRKYHGDRF